MRKEYDFSNLKTRRNPYAARLKKYVTIRLGADVIASNPRTVSPPAKGLGQII